MSDLTERSVPSTDRQPAAPAIPLRATLGGVLFDIAPPLIAYYGLRAAGVSMYVALLTGTLIAGVKVVYDVVKARRLDPFAGYLVLTFGLSLAVALVTTDARLILAGNTLVNGLGGLIFLVSCVVGTPLTQVIAERANPDGSQNRRIHVQLSAMWGAGLLIEVAVRLVVIFSTSVDLANGATSAISLSATGLLILATIAWVRRARPATT
jgi:intracellular septation protein A